MLSRIAVAAAVLIFSSLGAAAGTFTCTQAETASAESVMATPKAHVRQCVRVRGMLVAWPKAGAVLTLAKVRPDGEPSGSITVYFENDDGPRDLDDHPRYAEVVGRVLTCTDIVQNAMDDAARATREANAHADGQGETVYIGTPSGTCHYRMDDFAILISTYRLLPAPPPG